MQPSDLQDPRKSNEQFRYLQTLWIAGLFSFLAYYLLTQFAGRPEGREAHDTLFLIFVTTSVAAVLLSFRVKSQLLRQAVDQQDLELVKKAYSVAIAINDVGGLLGLIDFFITGDRYFYVLFIIGAVGHLFHFPRREHVLNASFKNSGF